MPTNTITGSQTRSNSSGFYTTLQNDVSLGWGFRRLRALSVGPGFDHFIGTLASHFSVASKDVATGTVSLGCYFIGIDTANLENETSIKAGDLLVIVNGTSDEIAKATDILKNSDANEVEETECAAAA